MINQNKCRKNSLFGLDASRENIAQKKGPWGEQGCLQLSGGAGEAARCEAGGFGEEPSRQQPEQRWGGGLGHEEPCEQGRGV